jgi:hypothetical protein
MPSLFVGESFELSAHSYLKYLHHRAVFKLETERIRFCQTLMHYHKQHTIRRLLMTLRSLNFDRFERSGVNFTTGIDLWYESCRGINHAVQSIRSNINVGPMHFEGVGVLSHLLSAGI